MRRILVIGYNDGLANSVRSAAVKVFLEDSGYFVDIFDSADKKNISAAENFKAVMRRKGSRGRIAEDLRRYSFIETREAYAESLLFYLIGKKYDAIICQSPICARILSKGIDCLKIYDCPTPLVEELETGYEFAVNHVGGNGNNERYYSQFDPGCIKALRKSELEIYKASDYLCFHWESYADFIKRLGYTGENVFIMNWGCLTKLKRARWTPKARIAFLGNLGEYWVNIKLLSLLAEKSVYPIDCYGKPKPKSSYRLNYKGPMAGSGFLGRYQFGLTTITADRLRARGFSAKTLDYVSYGLPVLMPKWRVLKPIIGGCIPYDESDYISQLETFSDSKRWKSKSDEAYEYAQSHGWSRTLKPLLDILDRN